MAEDPMLLVDGVENLGGFGEENVQEFGVERVLALIEQALRFQR